VPVCESAAEDVRAGFRRCLQKSHAEFVSPALVIERSGNSVKDLIVLLLPILSLQ
jgi:hypothetical protein